MISSIQKWLVSNRLVDDTSKIEFSFRLHGNWSGLCFVNGDLTYFFKVEHFGPVTQEFETLCFMHDVMPTVVPKPLFLTKIDNKLMYIQKAILHDSLSREYWETSKIVQKQLQEVFLILAGFKLKNTVVIDERIVIPYKYDIPKNYISKIENFKLPQVHQHGDFSANNLGVTRNGTLLFDWEDYALTTFPLMDLSVYLMSLYDFSTEKFLESLQSQFQITWLKGVLKPFDINIDDFVWCVPYALMCFISLKKQLGYSPELIQKIDKAIKATSKALRGVVRA